MQKDAITSDIDNIKFIKKSCQEIQMYWVMRAIEVKNMGCQYALIM